MRMILSHTRLECSTRCCCSRFHQTATNNRGFAELSHRQPRTARCAAVLLPCCAQHGSRAAHDHNPTHTLLLYHSPSLLIRKGRASVYSGSEALFVRHTKKRAPKLLSMQVGGSVHTLWRARAVRVHHKKNSAASLCLSTGNVSGVACLAHRKRKAPSFCPRAEPPPPELKEAESTASESQARSQLKSTPSPACNHRIKAEAQPRSDRRATRSPTPQPAQRRCSAPRRSAEAPRSS